MKPYPIPTLGKRASEEFIRAVEAGPTEEQKKVMREALAMFAKTEETSPTDKK